jgi:tRNA isopentenyl-2-thiomethyl-A-37 hydroxylase MiaE
MENGRTFNLSMSEHEMRTLVRSLVSIRNDYIEARSEEELEKIPNYHDVCHVQRKLEAALKNGTVRHER